MSSVRWVTTTSSTDTRAARCGIEWRPSSGLLLGPATHAGIRAPSRLALDRDGNLCLSSFAADRVFEVTTQGILEPFAGTGSESSLEDPGDGGLATAAVLPSPQGIHLDPQRTRF
jgi:hypothetical protein